MRVPERWGLPSEGVARGWTRDRAGNGDVRAGVGERVDGGVGGDEREDAVDGSVGEGVGELGWGVREVPRRQRCATIAPGSAADAAPCRDAYLTPDSSLQRERESTCGIGAKTKLGVFIIIDSIEVRVFVRQARGEYIIQRRDTLL